MNLNFSKYVFVLLINILLLSKSLNAQDSCQINLTVRIIDLDNGKELESALVIINETKQTNTTNAHGNITFNNLCIGTYKLLIQHIGCPDTIVNVNLKKDLKVVIKLPHSSYELNEIDIIDKQPDIIKTQTVYDLKDKELEQTRGQSLGEALKLVNGVTTLNARLNEIGTATRHSA